MQSRGRISLTLALSWVLAGPAAATLVTEMRYVVDPGSTITPESGVLEPLSGEFLLRYVGFCVLSVSPANCTQNYEVPEIRLLSFSLDLERPTSLPSLPGPFIPVFSELGIPMLGTPILAPITFDRDVSAAGAGARDYTDLVLRSRTPNAAGPATFGTTNVPTMLALELELVMIVRRSLSSDGLLDFPRRISTQSIATISLSATAVPEPGTAALLATGFAVLAVTRRR